MKKLLPVLLLSLGFNLNAQDSVTKDVQKTIEKFFDAFHQQDTTVLRSMAYETVKMQSISVSKEGKTMLNESDYDKFLVSIASIPAESTFEEKLLDFDIKVDGNMANAWTPYEFWYQGKFSHCGVNSFQLMKVESEWKIIYLVDTRRRDDCKANSKK